MDVLEEVEGKAIIWAHYQHDVMNIFKLLEEEVWSGFRGPLLRKDVA